MIRLKMIKSLLSLNKMHINELIFILYNTIINHLLTIPHK